MYGTICLTAFLLNTTSPADKRRAILARRAEGQSLREISRGVGISVAVVNSEVKAAEETATAAALDLT